jgi:DNA-(apurinic or apyrimidinic site) lyase
MARFDKFVELLCEFPQAVWDAPITNGVGWKLLLPVSKAWQFGHFAALSTMLGLNNYQTKGKADVGYWPKVAPFILCELDPPNPRLLLARLESFYSRERLAVAKVKRLRRFLESDLCSEIWGHSAATISREFGRIWNDLARTMRQAPDVKSIAFAARNLATALLMVGETRFDFSDVPIPVDLRIRSLPKRLGQSVGDDSAERRRWKVVLDEIRKVNPKVTMVHLDHLLWEIAPLSPREMQSYLASLGAEDLASPIAGLFGEAA